MNKSGEILGKLKETELNELYALRKILHQSPELAFSENKTSEIIKNFINHYQPTEVINIGETGVAFVFDGIQKGPVIMVRADMDALPITEINDFPHRSQDTGIAHKCGHDGHMTIVAGLAILLSTNRNYAGKVILLFQPAEETGEGAKKILENQKFANLNPDYILALHNLPGFTGNEIVYREKHFAAASTGMIIKLTGKTSHAAEPEKGNSPLNSMMEIIDELNNLVLNLSQQLKDYALITIIHTRLGDRAFGTTPGYAEIMATLRSYRNDDMDLLKEESVKRIKKITEKYGLKTEIYWTEEFPAAINDGKLTDVLKTVIKKDGFSDLKLDTPFKWSEDFGYFSERYPALLFGLGAGEETPHLHNPDYDFPDEIIQTGVSIFYSLLSELQK